LNSFASVTPTLFPFSSKPIENASDLYLKGALFCSHRH